MTEEVLIVTGGGRGIGAATARLAAERGWSVCVGYRQAAAEAAAVVGAVQRLDRRALAVQADVSREEDVVRLFERVDRELGTPRALVNNAGIVERRARVDEMDAARLARVFATNVTGSFLCAREAVKRMSTRHGGRGGVIVNVSSRASVLGSPGEYVDYAASKGAIDTFTLGLAREVATEGIRVACVRPGIIVTDIHASSGDPDRPARLASTVPVQRPGTADEVARAILWLLSEEASYSTGTFIDVAGGR